MKKFQSPATLSFWERETFFRHWDVAIIGSGIVGLSAAIRLKETQPALRVVVLERGVLPFGASTRNAGFACFGSMTELLDDLRKQPESEVWALVERRWRGLQRLRERVGEERMQYENLGGYEVFRPEEGLIFEECKDHLGNFNQAIENITGYNNAYKIADERIVDFGFEKVKHLIVNKLEGQLHTGKMMETLLQIAAEKGVKFLNGLEINHIESDKDLVRIHTTENWELQSNRLLVTTNGFARQLFPDLEVLPARNQVLITQPILGLRVKGAFHYDRGYFYFRDVDERILLGGGRNLATQTEQTDEFDTTALIRNALEQLLKEVIIPKQSVGIDTWWSGIMGIGEQKKPIVQEVMTNVFVAVRLGGMGVAIGSLVGEEGAELVVN
ncbi:MAG: FAD-dependent oxidoreductase [Saprospiraceae bacterium]|nr:FAD-dependent oxidoreductase [Saprospiraceae bacterium]